MAAIEDEGPERLAASDFDGVNAEHALRAVQRLRDGYDGHSFGASIDYDVVLEDRSRLPPKAVFGLAATEALGFEVLPKHFTGGEGSICFNRLREWGYRIEPKADEQGEEDPAQGMDLSSRASGAGFPHKVKKTTLAEGIRIPIEQHALFQADPLPRGKSDSIEIIMDGHSFEGRLYHENPKGVDREMMSFRYKSNAELLEVIGSYFPQLGGTLRVVVRSPRRVELVPEDVQVGLQEAVAKARGRSVDR